MDKRKLKAELADRKESLEKLRSQDKQDVEGTGRMLMLKWMQK